MIESLFKQRSTLDRLQSGPLAQQLCRYRGGPPRRAVPTRDDAEIRARGREVWPMALQAWAECRRGGRSHLGALQEPVLVGGRTGTFARRRGLAKILATASQATWRRPNRPVLLNTQCEDTLVAASTPISSTLLD